MAQWRSRSGDLKPVRELREVLGSLSNRGHHVRHHVHTVPAAQMEHQVWPEVPHVFQGFVAILDDADQGLNVAAAFIKRDWAD